MRESRGDQPCAYFFKTATEVYSESDIGADFCTTTIIQPGRVLRSQIQLGRRGEHG